MGESEVRANSSAGRALALHARGHRFEPCFAHPWDAEVKRSTGRAGPEGARGPGNSRKARETGGSGTKKSLDSAMARPLDLLPALERLANATDNIAWRLELALSMSSKGGGIKPDLIARN